MTNEHLKQHEVWVMTLYKVEGNRYVLDGHTYWFRNLNNCVRAVEAANKVDKVNNPNFKWMVVHRDHCPKAFVLIPLYDEGEIDDHYHRA